MAATSIHIKPVKKGSENHNLRTKDLDYINAEYSKNNEIWSIDTIANRHRLIKKKYEKTTGQKMQSKSTPIREGVVVIQSSTTMDQLKDYAQKIEAVYGIKTIQIYIHKDEGYKNLKQWKLNLHAHMLFDWTQSNGKSLKLNKKDMSDLQSILSECTGMDRGESSDIKHLNAIQFKNKKLREEEFNQIEKLSKRMKLISEKHKIEIQTKDNQIDMFNKKLKELEDELSKLITPNQVKPSDFVIPDTIKGVELSKNDKIKLSKGEIIVLRGVILKTGETSDVCAKIKENNIVFSKVKQPETSPIKKEIQTKSSRGRKI